MNLKSFFMPTKNKTTETKEQIPTTEAKSNTTPSVKALIGDSRIWKDHLTANRYKRNERFFYIAPDTELQLGTQVFNEEALQTPFCGSDGFVSISTTEGENDPHWAICRVDYNGFVTEFIAE